MRLFGCFGVRWFAAGLVASLLSPMADAGELRAQTGRAAYTVAPGDVLSVIAEEQGVPLALLRKVNGVTTDTIRVGQVLQLPRTYVVESGDALGLIAERHGVALRDLLRHNDLDENSVLKVGQRLVIVGGSRTPHGSGKAVPAKANDGKAVEGQATQSKATEGEASQSKATHSKAAPAERAQPPTPEVEYYQHEVRQNEVLSVIAARYAVSTHELSQINRLKSASMIRVGQRLKIPVTEQNAHLTRPKSWSKYARTKFQRGEVTLKTPAGAWTGRVLDDGGKVLPQARKRIQAMLASWETGKQVQVALHPRLYQLIVTVSDEFGGRPIRVVSGYRQRSYSPHSKHRSGRALDFSIPGVPNSALVDFLLTLPKIGVGYYPNTTHVHMDVRSSRMYWVDVSGPGQAPRYVHKSNSGERAPKQSLTGALSAVHQRKNPSQGAMARLQAQRQR